MRRLFYFFLLFPLLMSCSGVFVDEERRFNQFIQNAFDKKIQEQPELNTLLGLRSGKDQWNNLSESYLKMQHKRVNANLKELSSFDISSLSKQSQLSWRIFKLILENEKINFDFRFYPYVVSPFFGRQSEVTAFLINTHTIENIQDAKDYIARVQGIEDHFDQVIQKFQRSAEKGIVPPKFIFPEVEEIIKVFLTGSPIDSQRKHVLVRDFNRKISALNLSPLKKKKLNKELEQALLEFYKPAYEKLLNEWLKLKIKSKNQVGIWSQPQGKQYYKFLLRKITTTDLTPEEIHQLGLKEVRRLHLEIEQLKSTLNFKGNFLAFLSEFRNNKNFYYRKRKEYIAQSNKIIFKQKEILPEFFKTLPRYPVIIKQMESFMGKSAGLSFYQPPAIRGGRPGVVFVSLYHINERPAYALRALTAHETFPGRHLQFSTALSSKSLPEFRRHVHFASFVEGWALYAERLSDEMGLYVNKYDQFGALSSELMRACQLVVDTGLHYKKWSRDKAIDYLIQNSDVSYNSAVSFVERFIMNPGQATAGMIGFLKILELRYLAKKTLGDEFDIREFHHQVLKNGAVPLTILEENIRDWLNLS